jgi:hypothetical protein
MSYHPRFAILKTDLDKHKTEILDGNWQYQERYCEEYQVMDSLKFLLTKTHPLTLGKSLGQPIEFYTLSMEFSGQNQWLRDKLIELDIEFSTDY